MSSKIIDDLKRSAKLPSPPGMALQVLRLCQDDDVSIGALADTLATDPALSLRLLKYANSALFGAGREVTSIRDAVLMMGLRSVRVMALSFSLVSTSDPRACKTFDFDRFWVHSVARAAAARYLATRLRLVSPDEAFSTALVSHVGKLAFAVGMTETYPAVLQVAGGTLGRTERHEAACMGCSHYDLGADLLLEWGLPRKMADVIRAQFHPDQVDRESELGQLTTLIRVATDVGDILCQAAPDYILATRRQAVINSGLIGEDQDLDAILQAVRKEFGDLAAILSLKQGSQRSTDEIQAEAGAMLNEFSLSAQLQSEAGQEEGREPRQKATTDDLTGIANRRAFDDRLSQAIEEAQVRGDPLALAMVDIDLFKKLNETFGHQTGDMVLKAIAGALPKALRNVDFLARYGGEEFAVIIPNADRLIAAQICVKLRRAVELCTIQHGGRTHRVTVSIGAVLAPIPLRDCTAKTLIEAVDAQLYAAKAKGRNCCCMKQMQALDKRVLAGQR